MVVYSHYRFKTLSGTRSYPHRIFKVLAIIQRFSPPTVLTALALTPSSLNLITSSSLVISLGCFSMVNTKLNSLTVQKDPRNHQTLTHRAAATSGLNVKRKAAANLVRMRICRWTLNFGDVLMHFYWNIADELSMSTVRLVPNAMVFACPMCLFYATDDATLISHVCKIHRHDPNFLVYCSRCLRSFRVWDTYRKHRYRGCKNSASSSASERGIRDANEDEDDTMDFSGDLGEGNSEQSKSHE